MGAIAVSGGWGYYHSLTVAARLEWLDRLAGLFESARGVRLAHFPASGEDIGKHLLLDRPYPTIIHGKKNRSIRSRFAECSRSVANSSGLEVLSGMRAGRGSAGEESVSLSVLRVLAFFRPRISGWRHHNGF